METTANQPLIFMLTICGGVLAGIAYDVYKGVRRAIKAGKWGIAVLDVLFILTLGGIAVFVLFVANQGELRLYAFIGFTLGFVIYMAGLSPFLSYISKKIVEKADKRKDRKNDRCKRK